MPIDLSPLVPVSTEDQVEEFKESTDDRKHLTHIISPPENALIFGVLQRLGNEDPSAADIVFWARQNRAPVKALCGFYFVPELNPDAYDACQICMDVAGMHMRNAGE